MCSSDLHGLEDFSHLEVVFLFDRVDPDAVEWGSRHPRGNPAWPEVGILAQRAKDRPNRLGVSRCELVTVEGFDLVVRGLDAVPRSDWPPVLITHLAFQVMVGLGSLMVLAALWVIVCWVRGRDVVASRPLLTLLAWLDRKSTRLNSSHT